MTDLLPTDLHPNADGLYPEQTEEYQITFLKGLLKIARQHVAMHSIRNADEWLDRQLERTRQPIAVEQIEGLSEAIDAHREKYEADIFRVEQGNKNFCGMNKDRPKKSPSSIVLEAAMAYAALTKQKEG